VRIVQGLGPMRGQHYGAELPPRQAPIGGRPRAKPMIRWRRLREHERLKAYFGERLVEPFPVRVGDGFRRAHGVRDDDQGEDHE
jgi:hypothetical protein